MNEPIRMTNEDDGLYLRDGFVIVFFCRKPFKELAAPFARGLDLWLELTPDEAKKWACVGADSETDRPLTAQRLAAARREVEISKGKSKELPAASLGGPQDDNPDYRLEFVGDREIEGELASLLEVRLPQTPATDAEIANVVAMAKRLGELLPYSSGYASPALTFGADSQQRSYRKAVGALAFRHPGYDLTDSASSRFVVGDKLRGAYWLTFAGPVALRALGGEEALRQKLDPKIGIEHVGGGLMLQAGPAPEIGDVNQRANLPLLRSLAGALEPVTLMGDNALSNNFYDEGDLKRWLRRHLD